MLMPPHQLQESQSDASRTVPGGGQVHASLSSSKGEQAHALSPALRWGSFRATL